MQDDLANFTNIPIKTVSWVSSNNPKTKTLIPKKIPREIFNGKESLNNSSSRGYYNLPSFFHCINDVLFNKDNIPDQISATYHDDYDILHIHDVVMCKLEHEQGELPDLRRKKSVIERRLNSNLKIVERKKLQSQLDKITTRINLIETRARERGYLESSKCLLDAYRRLGPVIRVKSFLDNTEVSEEAHLEANPQQDERFRIIRQYLQLAKKYIPLNVVRIIPNDRSCPGCGQDLILIDPEDFSLERCEECGFERYNLIKPSFTKEIINQSKSVSNSDYEDRENFIKAFECYLGEQQEPPNALFEALDSWAEKYNHPPKEVIRQLPLNEDGTRGEYGKSMLLQALADEGLADYYKDVKLIGHLQWGWRLPSVGQQDRDLIIQDYDNTQKIFNAIPKERKSSLNTQYRLYRHLQARKIPCKPTDFKLPTTPGILEEQDGYWREMITVIPGAEFMSLK